MEQGNIYIYIYIYIYMCVCVCVCVCVEHNWRNRDELISDVLLWTLHMTEQKQDGQFELAYSSYMRIQDVALKTCQWR